MSLKQTPQYYHVVLKQVHPRAEPAFQDPAMQVRVWGRRWGCRSDVGPLRLICLHRPGGEMKTIDPAHYAPELEAIVDSERMYFWRSETAPDIEKMQRQHDGLAAALRAEGAEVTYLETPPGDPDGVFTRDMAFAIDGGAVICRMGMVGFPHGGRRGEEAYVLRHLAALGMPIIGTIHGTGLFEGGSFVWLTPDVAAAGLSFRGNEEGVRQVEEILRPLGVRLVRVPLTGYSLHLDGGIVMVDERLALINSSRLPYWFLTTLEELGIHTVEVDPLDGAMAMNCLAVRPGRVIMSQTGERTAERLHRHGVQTVLIEYDEIQKGGGGIHCSTLPLIREGV